MGFVRDGDVVIVHSMDRLARNLDDLRRLMRELTGRGVRVEFVRERLTFSAADSPMATLVLSVLGAFAEFECALVRERQAEGIALAKARGAYKGIVNLGGGLATGMIGGSSVGRVEEGWWAPVRRRTRGSGFRGRSSATCGCRTGHPCHATWVYSCINPSSRSRRRA
jgi:Resolvase, N terminal domain